MSTWTLIGTLDTMDERLLHALVARRRPLLDRVMRGITHLADPSPAMIVAAALALGLVPPLAPVGPRVALTLALAHGLVELLKRTIVRPRPRLPVGIGSLVHPPDRFSFPSGHAAAGLSLTLHTAFGLGLPLGAPLLLVGLLVGLSRCYLGVHYPGDVAAGWALACVAAAVAGVVPLP